MNKQLSPLNLHTGSDKHKRFVFLEPPPLHPITMAGTPNRRRLGAAPFALSEEAPKDAEEAQGTSALHRPSL